MKSIGGRFGLGGALAVMLLLAGTPACVPAGWVAAALLARCLVRENTAYKDMFISGLICYVAGLFWVWSMAAYLSGLNSLWVSLIFAVFAAAHALYLPGLLWLYRALPRALDRLALRGAIACVGIEWLPFKLFPWRIGQSQWSFTTFIQAADLGGTLLLTFIMVWSCEALYRFWRERRRQLLVLACALLLSVLSYGTMRLRQFSGHPDKELRVSLVQAAVPDEGNPEPDDQRLFTKLKSLTEGIRDLPDLVVWPETSLPFPVHESVFDKKNEPRLPAFSRSLNLLIGAKTYRRPDRRFNSVILIGADGRIPLPYNKRLPIPFGEYIPYEKSAPFLRYVHPSARNLTHGSEARIFDVPLSGNEGTARIAPFLCYEEIFSALGVEAVQKGASVLIGLSDDSWSGPGSEIPLWQHFALSAFRSVELRRSFVRTTTSGITAVLSPAGRISAMLPPNEDGVLTAPVELKETHTLYALLGGDLPWEVLAYLSFLAAGLNAALRSSKIRKL